MSKSRLHVKPDGDVWVVKKEGSARASAVVNTKREALERAADIARNQNLPVVVHGADGRIQRTYRPGDTASNDDCFITTACVKHHGLADDCYELTTLRFFRDTYMNRTPNGTELVNEYYTRAPALVRKLNRRNDSNAFYAEVLRRVRLACDAIEEREFGLAKTIYSETLWWLEELPD